VRTMRKLATVICLSIGVYTFGIRPRLLRWGATDDEVTQPFPGADLIPAGLRSATMAVTIDAAPSLVWPWLVQMGYDRAGWYSWDHLDNFGQPSATTIHPEWQNIRVGDYTDHMRSWQVAALEPERFLALRASRDLLTFRVFDPAGPRPRFYTDSTWSFLLKPLPAGRTRLIASGYWDLRPHWMQPFMQLLFLDLQHWIMQTRQFANLKRLAEGAVKDTTDGVIVARPAPAATGTD